MTTQEAKEIGIKEFLGRLGLTPKRENARTGMFLSPLREESAPSFSVDYTRNL